MVHYCLHLLKNEGTNCMFENNLYHLFYSSNHGLRIDAEPAKEIVLIIKNTLYATQSEKSITEEDANKAPIL